MFIASPARDFRRELVSLDNSGIPPAGWFLGKKKITTVGRGQLPNRLLYCGHTQTLHTVKQIKERKTLSGLEPVACGHSSVKLLVCMGRLTLEA